MTSLQNSKYEDALERITKTYGNQFVSKALRMLIYDLYFNETSVSASFAQPKLVRNKITILDGTTRIKPYDLRGIVSEQITSHLESEDDRNRAEVVFKYLSSYYSGNRHLSLDEISQGVEDIRSSLRFTVPDDSNKKEGKDDGKYKALSNLFVSDSVESNDYTLKFGIAVLGINLGDLENLLTEISKEEPSKPVDLTSKETEVSTAQRAKKSFFSSVFFKVVAILFLAIAGIYLYLYFSEKPTFSEEPVAKQKKIPAKREIKSSDLFVEPFPLEGIEVPNGGLTLEIVNVIKNDRIINRDTIGLDQVWVRFRITNLTEKKYFSDAIYIRFLGSDSLYGEVIKTVIPSNPEANVRFKIGEQPNLIFWDILSVDDFSIPENSQVYGIFEVSSETRRAPTVLEFQLGVSLYSGGKNSELESEESFRIGFSQ